MISVGAAPRRALTKGSHPHLQTRTAILRGTRSLLLRPEEIVVIAPNGTQQTP
jgi:hypothetical protein